MLKRLATAGALSLVLSVISASALADIVVRVAPPEPRIERVPAARAGYVWAPGHWEWRNNRHVWVNGHLIRERRGMHWQPDRWVARGGSYHYVPGSWGAQRWDRDRDGVPNRLDRDRDNDGVRNRADRDRDGDGVPNRVDSRPNNPNRR